mmetsp:Transcript_102156/g.288535  ORF Transcript_102156/g.288535 Transcript_102156/m.288535 type:complete len:246 (-) Transcript_102156:64-801(-)
MVVPLGGGMGIGGGFGTADPNAMPESMRAPKEVKDRFAKFWWGLTWIFIALCVAQCCAYDVVGAIHSGILGLFFWYLVRQDCEKMSQCCVLFAGVMCASYTLIGLYTLVIACTQGRVTGTQRSQDDSTGQKVITITEERHPFYDPSAGSYYMFQSIMIAIAIVPQLLGTILAYFTYGHYPLPLSDAWNEEGPSESRSIGGGGGSHYGGGGSGNYSGSGNRGGVRTTVRDQRPALFGGEGQRLGSS